MKLLVIIGSTRPGRAGLPIGRWFHAHAAAHPGFDVELADLKQIDLPFLDEPKHPRFRDYQHAHTKAWSATVQAADAFVFVTAEYNFNPPPPLLNAIDYLHAEWLYKPCGFVSYGGMSGGMRAVQTLKLVVTGLKMMPMFEAVTIPFYSKFMTPAGELAADEHHQKAASAMLDELARWAHALKTLRA